MSSKPAEWGLPGPLDGAAVVVVETTVPSDAVTVVTVEPLGCVTVVVVSPLLLEALPLDPLVPELVVPVAAALLAEA